MAMAVPRPLLWHNGLSIRCGDLVRRNEGILLAEPVLGEEVVGQVALSQARVHRQRPQQHAQAHAAAHVAGGLIRGGIPHAARLQREIQQRRRRGLAVPLQVRHGSRGGAVKVRIASFQHAVQPPPRVPVPRDGGC